MADDTLTLAPKKYDKLGSIHCGVTRSGFVSVGGRVHDIEDGKSVVFDHVGVSVKRAGDEYTFAKTG